MVGLKANIMKKQEQCYRREDRKLPLYIYEVHLDTYQILQRHRAASLPQHAFLVGLRLQTAVNYLSKSDKY